MKQNTLKNKKFSALWIAVHGLVFLLLAVLFFTGTKFKINTNLFDILPDSNASREVSKADAALSARTGRVFMVLVKSNSFDKSKEAAEAFYNELNAEENNSCFEKLSLYMNNDSVNEVNDYYFKNRYFLLEEEVSENLNTERGLNDFLLDSQMCLFNSLGTIKNIEEDPFDLSEIEITSTLAKVLNNGTGMNMLDGVLCCYKDDFCYVMLRGLLSPEGASITNNNSGVKKIYDAVEKLKAAEENNEVEFIYSGVPFHSYESSSSAQKEITLISIISMVLIIALCIYFFRNILPVISSIIAITLSAVFALSSVLIVFKQIHILTFVFGTTLIGTCLDYSVHFFVRWKGDGKLKTGSEIRKSLFKGITLSLVSTELCYLILCFAPFMLLKQVAVFSLTGILSSYLTVICIYPLFKEPKVKKELTLTKTFVKAQKISGKVKSGLFAAIVIAFIVISLCSRQNIRIDNNLKSFYTMTGKLLENETEANTVLDSGSKGWYFIVRGDSKDQVLENEVQLCKKLDAFISKDSNSKMTYNATSKYVPSKTKQQKSYRSFEYLFDELINQYILLGYDIKEAQKLKEELIENYYSQKDNFIDVEKEIPQFMQEAVSNLWIGQVEDRYYSVVMPMHFEDSDYCKQLASEDENVFFVNKVQDVSGELNVLTKQMIVFLAIAFAVMIVIMFFFYNWKKVLKIIAIPMVTVLACVAVFAACNIPLGFFSITGIILVFGLSIDYIIYSVESSEVENTVAIVLSFISSAISFGALALSTFAPVFMFGLAVFAGLTTAVVCTILLKSLR